MRNYSEKELTPVQYKGSPVKILECSGPAESFCFPLHWHERIELLFIDSGVLLVNCGGTEYEAREGDLIVVNCCQTHAARSGKFPVKYRAFMFEPNELARSQDEADQFLLPILDGRVTFRSPIRDAAFRDILNRMNREYRSKDTAYSFMLKAGLYELLGLLCRNYIAEQHPAASAESIRNILNELDETFCEKRSVAEISRKFGYDEAYFCRKFKAAVGITPTRYLTLKRLGEAERLLRTTGQSVEAVALSCGFSDPNYFSRCFTKYYGISPSAYRK